MLPRIYICLILRFNQPLDQLNYEILLGNLNLKVSWHEKS